MKADVLAALARGKLGPCAVAVRRRQGVVQYPAHDDEHSSLSIDGRGPKVLVHRCSGCSQADVIGALREPARRWLSNARTRVRPLRDTT